MATLRAIVKLLGGYRAAGFAVAALLALGLAGVQTVRLSHSEAMTARLEARESQVVAEAATALTEASELARLREHELATRSDAIGRAYERGLQDAESKGAAEAADLVAGRKHFRRLWQECEDRPGDLPGTAAGPGRTDGVSQGRADSTGRIVRAVESDAAQIRCLQAQALSDRGQDPGDLSKGCPVQSDRQL